MSAGLSREFFHLIKSIGESKSKQEEDRIIKAEINRLRKAFENNDVGKLGNSSKAQLMKELVVRLMYIELLGHDASWGYIYAVQLTAHPDLKEKRVGVSVLLLMLGP